MLNKDENKSISNNYLCCGLLALIFGLMFFEWLRGISVWPSYLKDFQYFRDDIIELILSKVVQGNILIILFVYHIVLLWWNACKRGRNHTENQRWWQGLDVCDGCKFLLVFCAIGSILCYWRLIPDSSDRGLLLFGIDQSTNVLVLLLGVVLGQFVEVLIPRGTPIRFSFERLFLVSLVLFLASASIVPNGWAFQFKYRNEIRATGLWVNPNTYGLLMAVGLVIGLAHLMQLIWGIQDDESCHLSYDEGKLLRGDQRPKTGKSILIWPTYVVGAAVILLAVGLLRSFSRGAWLAAGIGCIFVFNQIHTSSGNMPAKLFRTRISLLLAWVRNNKWILTVAGCSVMELILICKPLLNHKLAMRTISVVNAKDFSWVHRLDAWKGALQIMDDHPIIGVGWQNVLTQFANFYSPQKMDDSWSIVLNDYFTIGMALGIPALMCFLGLLWFSWTRAALYDDHRIISQSPRLNIIYNAVMIVFWVGFWFDGGLFKVALATPFWLFLELNVQPQMGDNKAHRKAGHADFSKNFEAD